MTQRHPAPIRAAGLHVNAVPQGVPLSLLQIGSDRVAVEHAVGPIVATTDLQRLSSWDELLELCSFDLVRDRVDDGLAARVATLFGALEPGGTYVVRGLPKPESEALLGERHDAALDADTLRGIRRMLQEATYDEAQRELVLRRTEVPRWLVRARTIAEAQPWAPTLVPAARYERIVPTIVGSPRPAARLAEMTGGHAAQDVPAQRVAVLRDVVVSGLGQVHPSDSVVLEDTFAHTRHRRERGLLLKLGATEHYTSLMDLRPREGARIVEGPAVLLKQAWDANFGHWIVDSFGRLAGLAPAMDLASASFVLSKVTSSAMEQIMLDSLRLLDVPPANVVFEASHPFTMREAIVPGALTRAPLVKHPAVIRFLEGLVQKAAALGGVDHAPGGRVYLSRNRTGKRELRNEEELLPALERDGYVVIHPETLSLFDQICTLGGASSVIGNMGAAFTSLAFSPAGVSVACLSTPAMAHDYFYDLVCHKQGSYLGIQAPWVEGAAIGDSFSLPLDDTLRSLEEHGFLS